jgi:uncharacterized protein (DUF58 family)
MIDDRIRTKIKKIKIYARRVMHSALSGDYLSAFKGSGLEFDQIREYQMGDDVRSIDWNNSAKMNKIMVKQYHEERDRTVIIALDVSQSQAYSSQEEQRKDMAEQLAASLAYLAAESKDKVGILFFSDRVEQWIPPSRGAAHHSKIMETIFSLQPAGKKTDICVALHFLIKLKKRNSVLFFISDWIDDNPTISKLLKIAACEYDFVAMRLLDRCEHKLPDIGVIDIIDPETGAVFTLDTHGSSGRHINALLLKRAQEQKKLFDKYRLDSLDLVVGESFINPLLHFFKRRIGRQI